MKRAHFLQGLALGSLALPSLAFKNHSFEPKAEPAPFPMYFAPHLGMFEQTAGSDPLDQLHFMADQGFTAFEDNELKNRSKSTQQAMAKIMEDRGLKMGVFVAHTIDWQQAGLVSPDPAKTEQFLQEIKDSIEVAKRINATWMTVVPGHEHPRLAHEYQSAHLIEKLKRAADLLESHGLVMVLEPLNFRDHPGQFLKRSPQAYQICKAVDSPSCKILFDIYHQQIQEGNLMPNIEACWDEIAYFQIGDNPGRNEPGTGEINYQNVFNYIHQKGYKGILGMEHGNSQEGTKGETAVIEAYRKIKF